MKRTKEFSTTQVHHPLCVCEETGDLYTAHPSRARHLRAMQEKTTTVNGSVTTLSKVKGLELDQGHLEVKLLYLITVDLFEGGSF